MTEDEDVNVKKERPPVRPVRLPVGPVRRTLFATSELFRGISLASADGFRAFSNAVDPEIKGDDDLGEDVTDAMFDANRRYFRDVAGHSRRFFDGMMEEGRRMTGEPSPEIDYDKLAKMVAAEMRKAPEPTPGATGPASEA